MSQGAIYAATGEKYIHELLASVATLKAVMPAISVAAFVDQPDIVENSHITFKHIIRIDNPKNGLEDKIDAMLHSPYEKTIYLDTDIYIAEVFDEVFDLLDRFDIAAKQDGRRFAAHQPHIPDAFPEYNSGVVAFRKSDATNAFFKLWLETYAIHRSPDGPTFFRERRGNQPAMRSALWESNLRIATLTEEYNAQARSGFLGAPAKIIHARNDDLTGLAAAYNFDPGKRVFFRIQGDTKVLKAKVGGVNYIIYSETRKNVPLSQISASIKKRGVVSTLTFGVNKIVQRVKQRLGL